MFAVVVASQQDWAATYRSIPSAARAKENLQIYTSAPHMAGTPEDYDTAMFTLKRFKEAGFDAFVDTHDVLLTYPLGSSLSMSSPVVYESKIKESIFASDASSADSRISWPFNAFSRSGNVTGPLVYVNYGSPEDYDALPNRTICQGAIVIVRYGMLFRGLKVRLAQQNGAIGVIIYSDPADDGFVRGPVFPDGPWRPPFSVQRGSTQFLSICPGDPTTPECGGNISDHVPSIPVQPLGYGDAYHLLANMGGAAVPDAFQGGLNFSYTLGGGSTNTVSLKVAANWTTTPIWNVCVDIPGSLNSSKFVLLGNCEFCVSSHLLISNRLC